MFKKGKIAHSAQVIQISFHFEGFRISIQLVLPWCKKYFILQWINKPPEYVE